MLRSTNLALRGMTLLSRFFLVFALAKLLTPEELGVYGLISATVTYALFIVGLDFYTYVTREIAGIPLEEVGVKIKSQGALSLVMYVLAFPLLLLVFVTGLLPYELAPFFFALVALELFGQELCRLLVALNHQLAATVVLFIRQGLWPVALVGLMLWSEQTRNLHTLLSLWILGGVLAVVLGVRTLLKVGIRGWNISIDRAWIFKGIRVALPLLVATLCLRGVVTVDRYLVDELSGAEILGAYVLFYGLANTLMAFLDAGVFMFSYPNLISAFKKADEVAFKSLVGKMAFQTMAMILGFSIAAMLILPSLLEWIGKPVYLENQSIFWCLLLATGCNALGMISHYILYSHGKDRMIIMSHVLSLPVFTVALLVASQFDVLLAVPLAMAMTYLFVLIFKSVACYLSVPRKFIGLNL